jgi:hypothetical protein
MALRAVASGARSSLLLGFSGAALGTTVAACADDTAKMFDPEALERGAKALREIQASPYAKKVSAGDGATPLPPPPACRCLPPAAS